MSDVENLNLNPSQDLNTSQASANLLGDSYILAEQTTTEIKNQHLQFR
jgi:hypothetical protein